MILGVSLVGSLFWQGWHRGELVDIDDQAAPIRFRIDINQAEWPELALLPGIGEQRARAIVDVRRRLGSFESESQLLLVRGIGPRTLQRVQPYLRPLADAPAQTTAGPAGSQQ